MIPLKTDLVFKFIFICCLAYMHVCILCALPVSTETRRIHWITWNWCETGVYRWLNVALWALGVEPQSSGRFIIAVNHGTIHSLALCFHSESYINSYLSLHIHIRDMHRKSLDTVNVAQLS